MTTQREATSSRKTKETQIDLTVCLDNATEVAVETSLPFLTHMLNAFACHGRFGLKVAAQGDIEVDPHHLVEDCGIMLGSTIADALKDSGPVVRAGCFTFPMDGSLAHVAIDLCGRPNLVWNVPLTREPIDAVDPELFRDFFKGLVDGLRATVHVNVHYSDNDHHALEAVFKAFGRALRVAVAEVVDAPGPLSSKGQIDD